jgi:hypothetical protein
MVIGYASKLYFRAGGAGPVGQAKTRPLFSAYSVKIIAFTNVICINVVMIATMSALTL